MTALITDINIADPDSIYSSIVEFCSTKNGGDSARRKAKLILILANHIGDEMVLREAMELAAKDG